MKDLATIFTRIGLPKQILKDQSKNVISKVLTHLWKALGVQPLQISIYNPQANGLVECFNGTLKWMFALDNPWAWHRWSPLLLFAIHEVTQASLGISPFEVVWTSSPKGVGATMRGVGTPRHCPKGALPVCGGAEEQAKASD